VFEITPCSALILDFSQNGTVHRRMKMIQKLRVKLARWILGKHCPCYQMGYHSMVDFQQRSADQLEKAKQARSANN
jgi:hypothetical protein